MPFLRPKTSGGKHIHLALDIGTEVVKALVCLSEGPKGRIIGVGKHKQKLGDMESGAVTNISGVIHNCNAAIKEAERMA